MLGPSFVWSFYMLSQKNRNSDTFENSAVYVHFHLSPIKKAFGRAGSVHRDGENACWLTFERWRRRCTHVVELSYALVSDTIPVRCCLPDLTEISYRVRRSCSVR